MYSLGENNEPGFQSRQVPVWKELISFVFSVTLYLRRDQIIITV